MSQEHVDNCRPVKCHNSRQISQASAREHIVITARDFQIRHRVSTRLENKMESCRPPCMPIETIRLYDSGSVGERTTAH